MGNSHLSLIWILDDEIDRRFGWFIREKRRALNMGLFDAAEELEIDLQRLFKLEQGHAYPGVKKSELRAFKRVYDLNYQELFLRAIGKKF